MHQFRRPLISTGADPRGLVAARAGGRLAKQPLHCRNAKDVTRLAADWVPVFLLRQYRRRFLFPGCLGIQVPRQFHGVVQNPADDNPIVLHPVNQKMPWAAHNAGFCSGAFPAQVQVPGSHAVAELRPFDTAGSIRLAGDVTQRRDQQVFVTFAGRFSELTLCPGEDVDEIRLRGGGESITRHQPANLTRLAACCPSWLTKSSIRSSTIST